MWELGGERKGFGDPGFSLANLMLTPFSRKTQAFTCLLALPSPPSPVTWSKNPMQWGLGRYCWKEQLSTRPCARGTAGSIHSWLNEPNSASSSKWAIRSTTLSPGDQTSSRCVSSRYGAWTQGDLNSAIWQTELSEQSRPVWGHGDYLSIWRDFRWLRCRKCLHCFRDMKEALMNNRLAPET